MKVYAVKCATFNGAHAYFPNQTEAESYLKDADRMFEGQCDGNHSVVLLTPADEKGDLNIKILQLEAKVKEEHSDYLQMHHAFYSEAEVSKARQQIAENLQKELDAANRLYEESKKEVSGYRKMLWVLARQDGISLAIPKKDLETIPDEAELLSWYEPMFDAVYLKGICGHADVAPNMTAAPIIDQQSQKRKCAVCGGDLPDSCYAKEVNDEPVR